MTPDEALQARRALALRLLESADFDGLTAFFSHRVNVIARDLCAIDPANHGALAQAQGQLREAMNYRDFKAVLERDVNNIKPTEKTG